MTDVVERLRRMAGLGLINSGLMDDAAREIERLRTALKRIDGINDNPADFNVQIEAVLRAALQPRSDTTLPPPA